MSYGHCFWTELEAREGISLPHCATPTEVQSLPYGNLVRTATGTLLTGDGTRGGVGQSEPELGVVLQP